MKLMVELCEEVNLLESTRFHRFEKQYESQLKEMEVELKSTKYDFDKLQKHSKERAIKFQKQFQVLIANDKKRLQDIAIKEAAFSNTMQEMNSVYKPMEKEYEVLKARVKQLKFQTVDYEPTLNKLNVARQKNKEYEGIIKMLDKKLHEEKKLYVESIIWSCVEEGMNKNCKYVFYSCFLVVI